MKDFSGKTAVVTGAAGGIGLALARKLASEGMRVVLADIDRAALDCTVEELRSQGFDVIGVHTDVSKQDSVDELARAAIATYGKVHVLCNNAGVTVAGGAPWERTLLDWQWCFGVNIWGVIHGLRAFVPAMIEHGEEGHIVNTASIAGIAFNSLGVYSVSKHAVVGLSEDLRRNLEERKVRIGASVLCPDAVQTRIMSSYRNRPPELMNPPGTPMPPAQPGAVNRFLQEMMKGWTPGQIAELTVEAIREDRFWIIPVRRIAELHARLESIRTGENPDFSVLTS